MNIFRAPSVALAVPGKDEPAKKWIQVAYEGEWHGHQAGRFKFTRAIFDTIVANFKRHPKYDNGNSRVIAFDLHHGSEMPLQSKIEHTLAHAWGHDVEVRDGAKGAELWALTELLDHTRDWIKNGQLSSVSVAVNFKGVDPVTGKECGPTITSIAFTNQPFLQDLDVLAASQNAAMRQDTEETTMHTIPKVLLSILALPAMANEVDFETKLKAVVDENRRLNDENPKLLTRNAELEAENKKLLAWKTEFEAKQVSDDVDRVMVERKLDATLRDALLLERQHKPEEFARKYPKSTLPVQLSHPISNQPVYAGPQHGPTQPTRMDTVRYDPTLNRMVFASSQTQAPQMLSGPPTSGPSAQPHDARTQLLIALSAMPGVNKHDRAMKYVRANGGKDLSHEDAHAQACMLLAQAGVPKHVHDLTELNLG